MAAGPTRILLLEDSPPNVDLLALKLRRCPATRVETVAVSSLSRALRELSKRRFDAVLVNPQLSEGGDEATLRRLRSPRSEPPADEAARVGAEVVPERHELAPRALNRAIRFGAAHCKIASRLEAIINHSADALVVTDGDGRVELVNPAADLLFGQPVEQLACLDGIPEGRTRLDIVRPDGTVRVAEARFAAVSGEGDGGRVVILRDVTEQLRTAEQLSEARERLHHVQRMDALGTLAGGVAHDFNNLLMVISGAACLLAESPPEERTFGEDVSMIMAAAERGASLTRQLLAFSCRQAIEPSDVHLDQAIQTTGDMLRRLIGEQIELTLKVGTPSVVRIDPGGLDQVMVNLALNARDAMPHGGHLEISVAAAAAPAGTPLRGPCAWIRVSDNGIGMSPETVKRAFEPFFTTKEPTSGTGLGLSTAYGIVTQAGGMISISSKLGGGTTVSLVLPIVSANSSAVSRPPDFLPPGAGQRILVVEDAPQVRRLIGRILSEGGYTVELVESGEAALQVISDRGAQIDLLLADVVLPGVSGIRVASVALEQRPERPVLMISGYIGELCSPDFLSRISGLLSKPLSPVQLLRAVRDALAESQRADPGGRRASERGVAVDSAWFVQSQG